jgi:hypothetical protein
MNLDLRVCQWHLARFSPPKRLVSAQRLARDLQLAIDLSMIVCSETKNAGWIAPD